MKLDNLNTYYIIKISLGGIFIIIYSIYSIYIASQSNEKPKSEKN